LNATTKKGLEHGWASATPSPSLRILAAFALCLAVCLLTQRSAIKKPCVLRGDAGALRYRTGGRAL
jgi:hypothetical protein